MSRRIWLLVALCAVVAFPTGARGADEPKEFKTGSFQIKVPTRCKDSAIPALIARLGWGTMDDVKKAGGDQDYNLSDEAFEVYVPPAYDGKEPYGLLVWVNPGPSGRVHEQWRKVLDKHKLIWVGANNSGNNRTGWVRLGMALDAAQYMPTAYTIDTDRVMTSGVSGGGRCASMLDIAYPEVFTGGGIYIVGCNFYRIVELTAATNTQPGTYYRRNFNKPKGKFWDLAARGRSHVFLTGDTDANREQTEAYYKAAKKEGFKHITYIQVPGMGHQPPDAEWFEKALVALEQGRQAAAGAAVAAAPEKGRGERPLPAPAEVPEKVARAAPARNLPATAANPASVTITAAPKGAKPGANKIESPATESGASAPEPDEPTKLLKLAKLYVDNRLYNKAREKLKLIVKDHPASAQAAEAKKLLSEIGNK